MRLQEAGRDDPTWLPLPALIVRRRKPGRLPPSLMFAIRDARSPRGPTPPIDVRPDLGVPEDLFEWYVTGKTGLPADLATIDEDLVAWAGFAERS